MIEVIQIGNRYTWRMICSIGRTLVYSMETWETDFDANQAAKLYRNNFWNISKSIDS